MTRNARLSLSSLLLLGLSLAPQARVIPAELPYALKVAEFQDDGLIPVVAKLRTVFDDGYPKLIKRFQHPDRPARPEIRLVFRKDLGHPAHASGGELTFSTEWFLKNPGDLGVMTHELTHIVQDYRRGNPGWLVEGI